MSMFLLKLQKRRAQTLCFHKHRVCSSDECWQQQSNRFRKKKIINHMNAWLPDYKFRMHVENIQFKLIIFQPILVWFSFWMWKKWWTGINGTQWTLPLSIHIESKTDRTGPIGTQVLNVFESYIWILSIVFVDNSWLTRLTSRHIHFLSLFSLYVIDEENSAFAADFSVWNFNSLTKHLLTQK